jgi:hypothetical protein
VGEPGGPVGAADGCAVGEPTCIIAVLKAAKLTEPSPVTGSHPGIAENPWPQHTFAPAAQLFAPSVISMAKDSYI